MRARRAEGIETIRRESDALSARGPDRQQATSRHTQSHHEMHIEQRFGVASGKSAIMKIRCYNIEKDRFSWMADRSTDGGKTWVKNHLQIEARRIGPPRSLDPLAPARNKTSAP
jgi:hypothetical protein